MRRSEGVSRGYGSAGDRNHRRKSAVRSKRKASTVDLSKLNPTQQLQCLSEVTAAHVTVQASEDKSLKQIETKLDGSHSPLALNNALEALKNNLEKK